MSDLLIRGGPVPPTGAPSDVAISGRPDRRAGSRHRADVRRRRPDRAPGLDRPPGQRRRRDRPHPGAGAAVGGGRRAAGVRRGRVPADRDHVRTRGPRTGARGLRRRAAGRVERGGAARAALRGPDDRLRPARVPTPSSGSGRPRPIWWRTGPATAGVLMATIAPELPGALEVIAALVARDVVVAIGHTEATAEEVAAAVDRGARVVTHLGNAMPPLGAPRARSGRCCPGRRRGWSRE